MKKLTYGFIASLILCFLVPVSGSFGGVVGEDGFYTHRSGCDKIILVAISKKAAKEYELGDRFYHYIRVNSKKWAQYQRVNWGKGACKMRFIGYVYTDREVIPTAVEGMISLYIDPDWDEENLIANFEDGVAKEIKDAWIKSAKQYIRELRHNRLKK